jgi:RND family efflux transporter MFP subunit
MNKGLVLSTLVFLVCTVSYAQDPADQFRATSTGVVMAERSVTLSAKIVGRVSSVSAEEGDRVDGGEILVDIEDAELRANLAAAQARLRMEELNRAHQEKLAERIRNLREQGTVSAENFDDANFKVDVAEQSVASAKAEIARARAMLAETKIRAPFAGVIIRRDVEPGDVTAPGEPLLILEDHGILKLRTSVKEQDIARIETGQTVTVTIDALDSLALTATVTKIIPSGDLSTHEFVVEATLPAHDDVYPGMFGKAAFAR